MTSKDSPLSSAFEQSNANDPPKNEKSVDPSSERMKSISGEAANVTRQFDTSLRKSIDTAVNATNATLAALEEQSNAASTNIVSRFSSLWRQIRFVVAKGGVAYGKRE